MKKLKFQESDDSRDARHASDAPAENPEPTPMDIIRSCGRQQLPIDRILLILSDRLSKKELLELKAKLSTAETNEYIAYTSSWASGEMDLGDALLKNAIGAEKDGYKSLSQERTRQSVNRAIEKNFGLTFD